MFKLIQHVPKSEFIHYEPVGRSQIYYTFDTFGQIPRFFVK